MIKFYWPIWNPLGAFKRAPKIFTHSFMDASYSIEFLLFSYEIQLI